MARPDRLQRNRADLMNPRLDEKPDAYFTGLFSSTLLHALRCLEQQDIAGAKATMRGSLDEFLRSDIGKDPQLRRALGVR
jgi:hypothetical protein